MDSSAVEGLLLAKFLDELGYKNYPVPLFIDNMAAIKVAESNDWRDCTRHIRVSFFFVQEKVEKEEIKVYHISWIFNLDDLFTKVPTKAKLEELLPTINSNDQT